MRLNHIAIALCDRSPRYRATLLRKVFGMNVCEGEEGPGGAPIVDIIFFPNVIIVECLNGDFFVQRLEDIL